MFEIYYASPVLPKSLKWEGRLAFDLCTTLYDHFQSVSSRVRQTNVWPKSDYLYNFKRNIAKIPFSWTLWLSSNFPFTELHPSEPSIHMGSNVDDCKCGCPELYPYLSCVTAGGGRAKVFPPSSWARAGGLKSVELQSSLPSPASSCWAVVGGGSSGGFGRKEDAQSKKRTRNIIVKEIAIIVFSSILWTWEERVVARRIDLRDLSNWDQSQKVLRRQVPYTNTWSNFGASLQQGCWRWGMFSGNKENPTLPHFTNWWNAHRVVSVWCWRARHSSWQWMHMLQYVSMGFSLYLALYLLRHSRELNSTTASKIGEPMKAKYQNCLKVSTC